MTDKMIKREIHGYMMNGDRVFLGSCDMTDAAVQRFLDNMSRIYTDDGHPPVFNVRSAVFNAKSFAGVQVLPYPKTKPEPVQ